MNKEVGAVVGTAGVSVYLLYAQTVVGLLGALAAATLAIFLTFKTYKEIKDIGYRQKNDIKCKGCKK